MGPIPLGLILDLPYRAVGGLHRAADSIFKLKEEGVPMKRKTFDMLLSAGGLVVVAVLIVAGSLLTWGSSFISSNVHNQLAAQQIYFPPASAFAHAKAGTGITPEMKPYLLQYAGQQMTTGAQAEAYANHFIANHLAEMPYGGVYAKASAAALAQPNNAALQGVVATIFKGTTLRGLLLNAYAFGQMGVLAGDAALASFLLAGVMLLLVAFGLLHFRRVPESAEVGAHAPSETVPVGS
jgi:hypothetical protein